MHSFASKKISIFLLTFVLFTTILPFKVPFYTMNTITSAFQGYNNATKLANRPILDNNKFITESYTSSIKSLVEGPTGIHGFVYKGNDGHFYFEDLTRARFWGVNLVSNGINIDHDTIDNITSELAENGVNMIRLHLIDSNYMASLIDYNSANSSNLNLEMIEKVDYLISKCGEKGIYIYLDLLDARSFLESEGVVNGSLLGPKATIVSIFNDTLIEMQKQYATNLFTHINPYTGLTYAEDPTIALVEITNENGMIWNPYGSGTGWHDIPEPYRSELKEKWNVWLLNRYGNRTELDKAWTSGWGEHSLKSYEDPMAGTVELPDVVNGWSYSIYSRNYSDPILGYPRVNDGSIFAYELVKSYFSTMKHHLRSIGVKVPIGASDDQWEIIPPTQRAIKEELDFSAAGYYYDHPHGSYNKIAEFSNTPELYTDRDAIAPVVSSQKIAGIPIVVREWNFPYPNDYRSEGIIQMAVFACLQDWDAVILHDLGESYNDLQPNKELVWWPSHNDPARWPQLRVGAIIFLNQLVQPLELKIDIGYSFTDTFFAQYGYRPWQYSVAPYLGQTQNYFFNYTYDGNADVVISSGRTSNASYILASRRIIINPWLKYLDLHCKSENITYMAKQLYSSIDINTTGKPGSGEFLNFAYDSKTITWDWDKYYPINVSTLPTDAIEFGNSSDDKWVAGFLTNDSVIMLSSEVAETTKVLIHDYEYHPNSGGDHNIFEVYRTDSLSIRIIVDSFNSWGLTTLSRTDIKNKVWHDQENRWVRDYNNGLFKLNIPQARAVLGFCNGYTTLSDVIFNIETHHAAVSVIALDNRQLNESKHILFTSVANAWNTNQNVTLTYNNTGNYAYSWIGTWNDVGSAPVQYEVFKSTIHLPRNITGVIFLENIFGEVKKTSLVSDRNEFYIYTSTGGLNLTSMEIIEDTSHPSIDSITSEKWTPEYNETCKVRAYVSDAESGLMNVSLIYRTLGGQWYASQMNNIENDLWEITLPEHPYNTTIEFYVYAEDYAGNSKIENNNSAFYRITWIDTISPILLKINWTPEHPKSNEDITITCEVQDDGSGVESVSLMYSINGSEYYERKMNKDKGSFITTISAIQSNGTISFFVIASDFAGNSAEFKNGTDNWIIEVFAQSQQSNQPTNPPSTGTHEDYIYKLIQDNLLLILCVIGAFGVTVIVFIKRKKK